MLKEDAQELISLVRGSGAGLYHTPELEARITLKVGSRVEDCRVDSRATKRWLTQIYDSAYGYPPSRAAVGQVVSYLEAKAVFCDECHQVNIRVGSDGDGFYVDLCNGRGEVVWLTPDGWLILDASPIKLRKAAGMTNMPHPVEGGSIEELWEFVNVRDPSARRLIVAWLVNSLWPTGPYPIITLCGEHGSSKSTTAKLLRLLLDPSVSPLRTAPRNEQELLVSANNSRVLVFDNMSGVTPALSDALCRVATGGGSGVRKLYSNDEEFIINVMRPIILNGIDDLAERADLADRCIPIVLPRIPEGQRRSEEEFWGAFMEAYPRILGALMDTICGAVRELPNVRLESAPRMADFAMRATAVERFLGWPEGSFMEAYTASKEVLIANEIESNFLVYAVNKLMRGTSEWRGTPTNLLMTLTNQVSETMRRSGQWPKAPQVMSGRLRRAASTLRALGIEFESISLRLERNIILRKEGAEPATIPTIKSISGRDVPTTIDASRYASAVA